MQLHSAQRRPRFGRDLSAPPASTVIDPKPVATTATLIPGTNVPFWDFSSPTIDGRTIAFNGGARDGKPNGLFAVTDGKLVKLVVGGDRTPRGERFTSIGYAVVGGAIAAFQASSGERSGIAGVYQVGMAGALATVADTFTQMPGVREPFTSFCRAGGFNSSPVTDGKNVVFTGTGFRTCGVFSGTPGNIEAVATSNMQPPDASSNFTGFGDVDVEGSTIVFFGAIATESTTGLYASISGKLVRIVSTKDRAPDGTGRFTAFGAPVVSGHTVAFRATTEGGAGIFAATIPNGPLRTIANLDTRSPSGVPFHVFPADPAISGNTIAFAALPDYLGIFASSGGAIAKVFDVTQKVGGKDVMNMDFSPFELSGNTIAFWLELTDLSLGVYTLTL